MFAYKMALVLFINIVIGLFGIILNFSSKFRITKDLPAAAFIVIYSVLLIYFNINIYSLKN